uniref:Uncharacterized protein n=1 Tax=Sinocyclocheilus grahami TaxID=75366 RepID=A0A672PZR6_SINGR
TLSDKIIFGQGTKLNVDYTL